MIEVALKNDKTYTITKEQLEYWKALYPNIDVEYELGTLKELWVKGAIPRKTEKNITKFINRHLYSLGSEDL
jgi:hypothetical protein